MGSGERTLKNSVSQRITLAPKRGCGCAFKRCCEEKCFKEIKQVHTHSRTKEEISKGVDLRVERMNLLAQSEGGANFETLDRMAAKLVLMLQGSAVPIDYGGTVDYSFCGDRFPIQTYSIEEMREILRLSNLDIGIQDAYVSVSINGRATGLSEPFADLLAWIAALRSEEGKHLERLMHAGGVNGVRAIASIAGEPAIDEKARKKFMVALCILASCISLREGRAHANNEELAAGISRFSTIESYSFTSSGMIRKRERGGMPLPLPDLELQPHRMKQMAHICIEGLFQANMNIANRIDSIINSGDAEIEENSERLMGMYESLKLGLKILLGGEGVSPKSIEVLADRKTAALYGANDSKRTHAEINERMAAMDFGEQNIVRYAVSRMAAGSSLNAESMWQFYRMFGTSSEYTKEIKEKMDRYFSA